MNSCKYIFEYEKAHNIGVVVLNYNLGNSFFANLLFGRLLIKHLACVQRDLLDQPQSRLS